MLINIVSAIARFSAHPPALSSNPTVLTRRSSDISLPDGSVKPQQVRH